MARLIFAAVLARCFWTFTATKLDGLLTRISAPGMIGFIVVQSLTDVVGHGADDATLGAWFDTTTDALILDQRAFWGFALLVLAGLGGGWASVDRLIWTQVQSRTAA